MGSSSTDADHRAQIRRQEVVTDLSQQALETEDLEGLLGNAATAVAETLDVEYCTVFERRNGGAEAVLRGSDGPSTDRVGSATVSTDRASLTGAALRAEEPVVVDRSDESDVSVPELLADRDVDSAVAVRIGPIDDPWGVLSASAVESRPFSGADADFLERVADVLGSAIENVRTRRDLERTERRFEAIFEDPNILVGLLEPDGTVVDINGTAMEYIDADLADVTGEPFWETPWWGEGDDVRDDVKEWTERAASGEYVNFEADLTRPDGERYTLEGAFRPVTDDEGEVTSVIVSDRDVTERKERERELEESEQRYRTLVDHFPNGAVALVDQDLTYRTVGGSPTDTADATADEIEGKPVTEAVPSPLADELVPRYEAALEGEASAFEATIDDRVFDFQIVPVRDDDGEVFAALGMSQDVTERYEYERQLEESEQRYRTLTEYFPNGLVTLFDHDLQYELAAGQGFDRIPVDPEDLEGRQFDDVWDDETTAALRPAFEAALDGEEASIELEYAGREWVLWVVPITDERGDVFAGMTMAQDITERKEKQRQLAESERRYRTLIENFPNGAVGLFDEDLRYQIAGGAAFDEIGASADDVVGKTLWDRYSPEQAERLEPRFRAALEGETNSFEMEFHGREWMAYTLPVADDDGEIFGGMIMVQEITERKERERKLRERERRLERYKEYIDDILDAIDDLFYVIDEDGTLQRWNRSLSEVTGYTDAELAEMDPPDFFEDDRDAALDAVRDGLETGSINVELELRTKDGDAIPFEFVASTLEDPWGNTVLAGIGRDVTERVERQQRLEESERRYRTLAQHFPNGAVGVYDHDLEYTLAEGKALGETLPPAERLEGTRMPELFPDHTVADLEPLFRAAVEDGETGNVQTEFGGRVWRVWATPLRDADGEIFAGLSFAQDVTERVEREKHLERYETIVETVNDGVYVVDEDGTFTMVNEAYAAMLGYDPDELVGEHVSTVVDDSVSERVPELMAEQADRPTLEANVRTADGDSLLAEATFAMLPEDDSEWHRVGVVRDISERKERERQLEESERRYRTLVENFPDGAVGLYDEDLEYIVVGGEAFDDLGISEDEVAGATLEERYPDDLVEEIEPHFRAVFDGESNTFEYRIHGRDVWAHTLPVRNEDDEIFAGMIMVQDVTERREYERKLEESNERLERFAYAASHDLQEPLRMVTSYLTLLENRYADAFDEEGREFLEFAVDGADRMREMIDGLLEYSRVETRGDPFEPMDLNAVLEDVLADLQVRIEETDAEVTIEDLPRVEGDASQVRQVFQNLLSNALTYSGDEPPRIHVGAERRAGEWVLSVEDEGVGIDPEDQDRVFTIFDRLHSREEYAGTGIGLALCERIVERHGGEIWVESEPGEGSTFFLTLPAVEEE